MITTALQLYVYRKKDILLVALLLTLSLVHLPLEGQVSDYVFTNYTIEDGLPSNECYEVIQDSRGYIWVATDNGVARFDGYEFKTYGKEQGLDDHVIFHMQEDKNGNIWMGGLKNRMFIYRPAENNFVEFPHNDVIKNHIYHSLQYLKHFYIGPDTLYIGLLNAGILKFPLDTKERNFEFTKIYGPLSNLSFRIDDQVWLLTNIRKRAGDNYNYLEMMENKLYPEVIGKYFLPDFDFMISTNPHSDYVDSLYYFFLGGNYYVLDKKGVKYFSKSKKFNHVMQTSDGKLVVLYDHNGGAVKYDNYLKENHHHLLENVSTTYMLEDKDHGYWITTLSNGLYYFKPLRVKHIIPDGKGQYFRFVINGNKNEVISCTFSGDIFRTDMETMETDTLVQLNQEIYMIEYDRYRDDIFYSKGGGFFRFDGKRSMEIFQEIEIGKFRTYSPKELFIKPQEIVAITGSQYQIYDPSKKKVTYDTFDKDPPHALSRFFDLICIGEEMFFATQSGVLKLKDIIADDDFTINEKFNKRIETLDQLRDSVLILGTKGKGIVLYDFIQDKYLDTLDSGDGLSSDYIEKVFCNDPNVFWVSTLSGLNKVLLNDALELEHIHIYDKGHGLPSNDIYQNILLDNTVIVATGEGLVRFEDQEIIKASAKPVLRHFITDFASYTTVKSFRLPYDQNSVKIGFITINYQLQGNINYRYKLNDGKWLETNELEISLLDLAPSDYRLQVQSMNEDRVWSESLVIPFTIEPPIWKTWWFLLVALFSGSLISFLILYRFFSMRRKMDKIRSDMQKLEKAALRKQMNPHFIFNSLNSIQAFIMENKKNNAMEYLAMFARLIRMILNAANEEYITIDDEVQLLKHYLHLEKLRFNERFDFDITIGEGIDPLRTSIPSMLIQPIAENAVVHGMKKKQSGGKILIKFKGLDNQIQVDVLDNGPGFKTQVQTTALHKSLGMEITRERLKLDAKANRPSGRIEISRTREGWTLVRLIIPIHLN